MGYKKETWTAADVLCPFYIDDSLEQRSIRCEGYCSGADLTSRFRSIKARDSHMGSYCAGRYERCPVYSLVYREKYDD